MNNRNNRFSFLILFMLGLSICGLVSAGTLTNASITPADLGAGVNTTYTVQFTTVSALDGSVVVDVWDDIGTPTNNVCNPIFDPNLMPPVDNRNHCTKFSTIPPAAFTVVNQPASLQNSMVAQVGQGGGVNTSLSIVNGGSAGSGVVVSFELIDVTNPTSAGTATGYTIQIRNASTNAIIDSVGVPGITFTGSGGPTVLRNIPDADINEDDGTITLDLDSGASVDTDLNNSFMDDNGQTLTFSIDSVTDSSVVTAAISADTITLTGLKTGSTDVTVRATDTDMNSVTDTFNVSVTGALNPSSVTPASLVAGDTTEYTLTFKPAVALGVGDKVTLSGGSVIDYVGATSVSVTGGTLGVSSVSAVNAGQTLEVSLTGSASTSDTVSLVIGNITNPGASGLSAAYVLETQSGTTNGHSTVAGNTFTAPVVPTISHTIPSQTNIRQEDGAFTIDLDSGAGVQTDLNYTFGGNPPLTFSIDSNTNPAAATVMVTSDTLFLTPLGTGSTIVTVKATDTASAFITTSFNVTVLGALAPASVTPSNVFVGLGANYTVTLTPNTTLMSGDRIRLSTLTGLNQTSSALVSLAGGTIAGMKSGGDMSETIIQIDSGSVSAGTLVTMELSGLINPTMTGMSSNYQIFTDDGTANGITGVSTISGHVFVTPSETIFKDGFETTVVVLAAKNTVKLVNKSQISNQPIAEYDEENSQYLFMNQSLSVKNQGKVRTMDEVLQWFKNVLYSKAPTGDFDADGISNEFDSDPFGIVPVKK